MRDIPFIDRFVELTLETETLLLNFRDPLERILCLFAVSPMLTRSSEVLHCKRDLIEHFNFLSYLLLSSEEKCVQDLALRALWCLLDKHPLPRKCCLPLRVRHEVVSESHLAETLAEMLKIAEEELYSMLLKFALLLSEASEAAGIVFLLSYHLFTYAKNVGFTLIEKEVVNVIMLRLEPNWSTRNRNFPPSDFINSGSIPNCDTALKLLWVLLASLKSRSVEFLKTIKPPDQQSMW